MSTSGRNWGGVSVNGSSLMFHVDGKVAFEIPLPDVSQAQVTKVDCLLVHSNIAFLGMVTCRQLRVH